MMTPVMKVPDEFLEKLRCRCGRYLSKAPIKIQDGQSICEDCVDISAPPLENNTPYETLASLFVFPCRYTEQGCHRLVKFGETESHELVCSYRTYNCPESLHSTCNWKGAVSQLYQHYKTEHPELCLKSPNFEFCMVEDFEVYKLVDIEGFLLLLQIKCQLRADKLWFNMVCFRNTDDAELINFGVELKNTDTIKRFIKLESAKAMPVTKMQMVPSEASLDVDLPAAMNILKHPQLIQCRWIIYISDTLKKKIKSEKEKEAQGLFNWVEKGSCCPDCGIDMMPPIYQCEKSHVTCIECIGFSSDCKTCQQQHKSLKLMYVRKK